MSVNKVILVGNLGQDPEINHMPNGGMVANLRVATSERWRDRDSGEQRENTEWHRVVFYGRLAEIANDYLRKGNKAYIEGRLQTRKWQGQDGQDRYTTEIIGTYLDLIDSNGGQSGGQGGQGGQGGSQRGGQRGGQRGSQGGGQGGGQQRGNYGAPPAPPAGGNRSPAGDPGFGEDDIPF